MDFFPYGKMSLDFFDAYSKQQECVYKTFDHKSNTIFFAIDFTLKLITLKKTHINSNEISLLKINQSGCEVSRRINFEKCIKRKGL